jgi:signal transduction histidine kinase
MAPAPLRDRRTGCRICGAGNASAHGGSGLGPALAARIIEAHGAQVSAEGRARAGSASAFVLPGA